jgi:hypothetical protein
LGIPVVKQIGGITVPKTAKNVPHFSKPKSRCVLVVMDGN